MSDLTVEARARAGSFELDARFSARPGVTVLFGPTASGKSMTLRLVAGLDRLASGAIRLGEETFDDARGVFVPPAARGLGYAPQDAALWPHRSVLDHLSPFTAPARARELLALVGLERHEARRPVRLSGGERQRLALARALARSPRLLLLDEPFSALDDATREEMGALIEAQAERGAIVLFVTHDRREATRLGNAFVLFDAGRTREASVLP